MASGLIHGGLVSGAVFVLLLSVSALQVIGSATVQGSKGFSMKLIPKYSDQSPMNPGNLTVEEKYALILQLSHARASRLSSMWNHGTKSQKNATTAYPNVISPRMEQVLDSHYLVEARIGEHRQQLLLHLDTASELTWVQCAHCSRCFELQGPPFEFYHSNTFGAVGCKTQLCHPGDCDEDDNCIYTQVYGDGEMSRGILSGDDFSFHSEDSVGDETIKTVIFGCGLDNPISFGKNTGPHNRVAGMLGLSRGTRSFLTQLGQQGLGRFSYCLPHWTARETVTYLRFGTHASLPSFVQFQSTPLLEPEGWVPYFLDLSSMLVNGESIGVSRSTFAYDPVTQTGGMIIDTGSPLSYIPVAAYFGLTSAVEDYFRSKGYRLVKYDAGDDPSFSGMGFCFRKPSPNFNDFPTITFVFTNGARFTPNADAAFGIFDTFFCLQIRPPASYNMGILGSFIQTGHIFVHDVKRNLLLFGRADCNHAV